jgi:uncharacterized protein YjbI with pentapeptide repeats
MCELSYYGNCDPETEEEEYCIFHRPNKNEKEAEEFWRKFFDRFKPEEEKIEGGKIRRFVFKEDLDCSGYVFPASFGETGMVVRTHEHARPFCYSIFKGNVDLSEATFSGDVDFSYAKFEKKAVFSWTKFSGDVIFLGTKFSRVAVFSNAKFEGKAFFSGATFSRALFIKATFSETADFSGTEFEKKAFFLGTKFSGNVHFSYAKFEKNMDFSEAKFSRVAVFSNAEFSGDVIFVKTNFSAADFIGTKFSRALFIKATFSETADFSGTEFEKKADFSYAKFSGDVHFSYAKFSEEAVFSNVKFEKESDFLGATFSGNVDFSGANFEEKSDFSEAKFEKSVLFSNTRFYKFLNFLRTKFPTLKDDAEDILSYASFRSVYFEHPEWIVFDGVEGKAKISFINTDISRVVFRNCSFDFLYDEFLLKNRKKLEEELKVVEERINSIEKSIRERIYSVKEFKALKDRRKLEYELDCLTLDNVLSVIRMLRENFDYYMRYEESGRLFVKEMDLKRDYLRKGGAEKRRFADKISRYVEWFAYSLYRIMGLYGESIARPIFWIPVIIILFGVLRGLLSPPLFNGLYLSSLMREIQESLEAFMQLRWDGSFLTLIERIISALNLGVLYISLHRKLERRIRH